MVARMVDKKDVLMVASMVDYLVGHLVVWLDDVKVDSTVSCLVVMSVEMLAKSLVEKMADRLDAKKVA